MGWVLRLLLTLAVVGRSVVSQIGSGSGYLRPDYVPVCDPFDYMRSPNPPIPRLPDQFSTIIEAAVSASNSSFIVSEHFDYPGNRGRLDIVMQSGEKETVIFDYDLDEAFLIPDRERGLRCGVVPITGSVEFANDTFGVAYVNGSVHIGTVANLFHLAAAVYIGAENVRGIPCNRWQTCHVFENKSYTLDYYFVSTAEWIYYFPGEAIPVKVKLTGSTLEDGDLRDLSDSYNFVGFHSGPSAVPDSAFEVPTGLPCAGRVPGKGLPSVPPYFSFSLEELGENAVWISTEREFYDSQLYRLDYSSDYTPYSIIHDFELGVQYVIDRSLRKCNVDSLNNTAYYDIVEGPNGTIRLRPPASFLRLGSGYDFSYEGRTRVRGIEADAWISIRDSFPHTNLVNVTVELFYTPPGWTASSLSSYTTDPIPLALNLTGMVCSENVPCTSLWSFFNIFDFSTREPEFDAFDTSACADPGQYQILSMIIPGQESGMDISQLRRGIRLGLTEWAGLPPLQVANIQAVGENGTHIFSTLQILPIPSVANYDNPRTPLDVIKEILIFTSPDDQLPFSIELPSGVSVRPFLLRVDPDCPVPSTTTSTTDTKPTTTASTTETKSTTTASTTGITTSTQDTQPTDCPKVSSPSSKGRSGVPSGTVAGISIVMFIVGVIAALALVLGIRFCRSKRRHFNILSGKYRLQENEMEGFAE